MTARATGVAARTAASSAARRCPHRPGGGRHFSGANIRRARLQSRRHVRHAHRPAARVLRPRAFLDAAIRSAPPVAPAGKTDARERVPPCAPFFLIATAAATGVAPRTAASSAARRCAHPPCGGRHFSGAASGGRDFSRAVNVHGAFDLSRAHVRRALCSTRPFAPPRRWRHAGKPSLRGTCGGTPVSPAGSDHAGAPAGRRPTAHFAFGGGPCADVSRPCAPVFVVTASATGVLREQPRRAQRGAVHTDHVERAISVAPSRPRSASVCPARSSAARFARRGHSLRHAGGARRKNGCSGACGGTRASPNALTSLTLGPCDAPDRPCAPFFVNLTADSTGVLRERPHRAPHCAGPIDHIHRATSSTRCCAHRRDDPVRNPREPL
jgi:hypothetical protein